MPRKKYIVELTSEERSELQEVLQAKKMAAHKRRKARILLKVDQGAEGPGWTDDQAAAAFDCRRQTVERLRQRVVERGFECILKHGNIGAYRAKALDGVAEAHTIALACGDAPEGRNRWTVRLLADKLEIHYTPVHGSWLNTAEIELSVLSRQCMKDYFENRQQLADAIAAWERSRNENKSGIEWRFTTADARIKLKKLCPSI
jgi:hypothetical protein